jgi:hypothetical protein
VKRGSLLVSDFKASQRESLHGPQGPQGVAGPSGATKVVARFSNFQLIPADTSNLASVDCFPGEVATGGGYRSDQRRPPGHRGHHVAAQPRPGGRAERLGARAYNIDSNGDNLGTIGVRAYAICASP